MTVVHRSHQLAIGILTLALVSSACSSSTDATTTTNQPSPVTTLATTAGSDTSASSTTTTEVPKTILTAPEYRIVQRIVGDNTGDTVVVQLDPASYNSLTDIDLYDLIAEIVELFPPIATIHIVDSSAAALVVANPEASEADKAAVSANYLARLDNGVQITYLGPFTTSGTAVLGS